MNPSTFQFQGFFILESHFSFKNEYPELNVNIAPSGKIIKQNNRFELILDLTVSDKETRKDVFIRVISNSIFKFESELSNENSIPEYFIINAPAICFPYIRAYISTLTIQSGLPAIVLPTYNLQKLAELLKTNIEFIEN